MPLPSAIDACRTDLFTPEEELRERYPAAFAERILRIRDMYNYWLANPAIKDRQLRDQIMSRYDVSQSCAYSDIAIITDREAIETARKLARLEGLMCGISSGANVAAALRLARKLGEGKTVVTILPDTGERYFSTPLFDEQYFEREGNPE